METEKSQDLQSASWRAGRADGAVLSNPKASRPEAQEEPVFQFEREGRKRTMSQLSTQAKGAPSYSRENQTFVLFKPSTDWVRPTHIQKGNLLYSVY